MRHLEEIGARLPPDVLAICRTLKAANKRGWVVGGCVRDLLRGQVPNDWDVATDARPEEVMKLFRKVIPTGIEHGTVTVMIKGAAYEVTTLRGEGAYADGRRPDRVHFLQDIEQDLARRDFTFNAIAWEPLTARLVDPFGGRDDLAAKLLRAVGDPCERFYEDGLRILRAARFAATLQCDIDAPTLAAMAATRSHNTFRKVSAERIHDEWLKALGAAKPSVAFALMQRVGLLPLIDKRLHDMVGCVAPLCSPSAPSQDVWAVGLALMDDVGEDRMLRLAALLHGIGWPPAEGSEDNKKNMLVVAERGAQRCDALLRKLKFSNAHRQRCVQLVRHHRIALGPAPEDAAVRRWVRAVSAELALDIVALARAHGRHGQLAGCGSEGVVGLTRLDEQLRRLLRAGFALTSRDLDIDGAALMAALQLRPGRHVGQLLAALLEQVTDEPALNRKEALLARAKSLVDSGEVTVR
ncbi:MAG TPA: hypothetical protein ENK23_03450 [Sorangium sp.]|nr:hypothetical protein [Sorangium sp.]